ncbi:hypothetical protein [Segatella maculosa]|uniref:hypothetical protein n=1 Tax=Segatella maculosa TaxID=439703 RepID=UPI00248F9C90|nr:hypothetical protein [Segatella maculosa]
MLQRRSFSSMGLISNSHRVERSANFLIKEKCKSCCYASGQDRVEAAHALHARASQDNGSGFAKRLHAGWHWIASG